MYIYIYIYIHTHTPNFELLVGGWSSVGCSVLLLLLTNFLGFVVDVDGLPLGDARNSTLTEVAWHFACHLLDEQSYRRPLAFIEVIYFGRGGNPILKGRNGAQNMFYHVTAVTGGTLF